MRTFFVAIAFLLMVVGVVSIKDQFQRTTGNEARRSVSSFQSGTVRPVYRTVEEGGNIDSVTVWLKSDAPSESLLVATAKERGAVEMYYAGTGMLVKRQETYARPNGIALFENILYVTDRDAGGVQGFTLPALELEHVVGDVERPYGITIGKDEIFVTSANGTVYVFDANLFYGDPVRVFETGFERTESIIYDSDEDRLYISNEDGSVGVYTTAGTHLETFGSDAFQADVEGIALYRCPRGEGYIIVVDQTHPTQFEVFDRISKKHIGQFVSVETENTDGIALTQERIPRDDGAFDAGAFFAAHDDRSVHAFAWKDIAEALGLRVCVNPAT